MPNSSGLKLKMWDSPGWTGKLTNTLSVGMVDEDIDVAKQTGRKPWYLSLTQEPDLLARNSVRGLPRRGRSLLLYEDDIVALVKIYSTPGL